MAAILVAIVVAPALVGAGLLLAGCAADRRAVPAAAGCAGLVAFGAVLLASGRPRPAVGTPFVAGSELGLGVDALAAAVLPAVAIVAALVLAAATGFRGLQTARFAGLMLIFLAAVLLTVVASTVPALLLGWEMMGAISFALIGYRWRSRRAVSSGTIAFVTTRTADLGLYVAAGAALAGGAGLALSDLAGAPEPWRGVIAAGVLLAGIGKAAQLPFSFWLARAMDGPSPVSALLHSAAMVAMGGYLLLRLAPVLAAASWAAPAAAWIGAGTAVLLGAVALAQTDIKLLLAASTSAQLGFVVLAAGVGGGAAGASHLIAHAAVKAGLFVAAGLWLQALGTKELSGLTGVARRYPAAGLCAAAGLVSLAGIPPFALWATKDSILGAAADQSAGLYAAGLVASALSAGYAAKAFIVILAPQPAGTPAAWDTERAGTRAVPAQSVAAIAPLAAGALALGTLAFAPAAQRPGGVGLAVSGVIAVGVAGVLAGAASRGARPFAALERVPILAHWFFLEPIARHVVLTPVDRLARLLARIDDVALDGGAGSAGEAVARGSWAMARADDATIGSAVGAVTAGTRRLAAALGRADDDGVDAVVRAVAGTARWSGRRVSRLQTGQVHQYYLQALAILAAAVIILAIVG